MKLHLRAYTITMRPYMQVVHRCTSVKPLTHKPSRRPSRRLPKNNARRDGPS